MYLSVARARGLSISASNPTAIETGLTWSRFLSDIPAGQLSRLVELAMDRYAFDDTPFGVPQLRAAWNELHSPGDVAAEDPESVKTIKRMSACNHDYQFTAEEGDSSIFAGFWECSICGHAKPRINLSASPRAVEYLKGAVLQ